MNGFFKKLGRYRIPPGVPGTMLAVGLLLLLSAGLSLLFRQPAYWLLGVALLYAIVLSVKRHKGSGDVR